VRRSANHRKITDKDRTEIAEAIPSSRGKEFRAFCESGLSLSEFVSAKTGIRKERVAGVIAGFIRAWHDDPKSMQKAIQRLLHKEFQKKPKGMSKSEWLSKEIGIPKGEVAANLATLSRTENRLLVIDATFESRERKSEGKHLKELFRIYDWNGTVHSNPVKVSSQGRFIEVLKKAKEKRIHISAHGAHISEEGTIIAPSTDSRYIIASAREIAKKRLWTGKKPRLVVLAACETGYEDMARAWAEAGCKYFIAPQHCTVWSEAALFNTLFYYYLFVHNKSEFEAYNETMKFPDLANKPWVFYEGRTRKK